jgi:hypothetical protein
MNGERFFQALGAPWPAAQDALPLVSLGTRAVTIARRVTRDALELAARRGTPLVAVAERSDREVTLHPDLAGPWPLVIVGDTPWLLRAADYGLLVGCNGPADQDGLEEEAAAALVREFLALCEDGPSAEPGSTQSLLDVVPYDISGRYDINAVLATLLDKGEWVEFDVGSADEVLTLVGRIGGRSVGVAASRASVNRGQLSAAGCLRVERLLRWCQRGRRPFVSLVDTAGVQRSTDAMHRETSRRAAACARRTEVTKVAIVLGWAVGLGATVLGAVGARADMVLPWPRAHFALQTAIPGMTAPEAEMLASVEHAARSGDVLDVIHPDETRQRVMELMELQRGRREYEL